MRVTYPTAYWGSAERKVFVSGTIALVRREIRYVELKTGFNDDGPASISWVTFSKTNRTIYHQGRTLQRIIRGGNGSNHRDVDTGEHFWISGVKKNGEDRHWAGKGRVVVDEDAREEYERITGRSVDGR
jgi:hypothetical protein